MMPSSAPLPDPLAGILGARGLAAPDRRPLHAYRLSAEERKRLKAFLRPPPTHLPRPPRPWAAAFVLWAAEEIRAEHQPGHLTWKWLLSRLDGTESDRPFIEPAIETGLDFWLRPLRRTANERSRRLHSLMFEGGIPDSYLREAPRYRDTFLRLLEEIGEASGRARPAAAAEGEVPDWAERIAHRHCLTLPRLFHDEMAAALFAKLALTLLDLREAAPAGLRGEEIEAYLDRNRPGWQDTLPLRLSEEVRKALIRPALHRRAGKPGPTLLPCRRELRRTSEGGWEAVVVIAEEALVPEPLLGPLRGGHNARLRLRPPTAADTDPPVFEGLPAPPGRPAGLLIRPRQEGRNVYRLPLTEPVILAAYADGRPRGEITLEPALPPPDEAPSFWCAPPGEERGAEEDRAPPRRLHPAGPRSPAPRLWLLTAPGLTPAPTGPLRADPAFPLGGEGVLWALEGRGELRLGEETILIETGREEAAPTPPCRLFAEGRPLRGWRAIPDAPLFCGPPQRLLGQREGEALRTLTLPPSPHRRRLFGQNFHWQVPQGGEARLTCIVLPEEAALELSEPREGEVRLAARGLPAGLLLTLSAGGQSREEPSREEGLTLTLTFETDPPAEVTLKLHDPGTGRHITLTSPWPARHGMLTGPGGWRVKSPRTLAAGALRLCHAVLPAEREGDLVLTAMQEGEAPLKLSLRLEASAGKRVALAGLLPLVRLLLAEAGSLDAGLSLTLVVEGRESPRLALQRYDRTLEREGDRLLLPAGEEWELHALPLAPAGGEVRQCRAADALSLSAWLGEEPVLWLLQARSTGGAVARPFAWAPPGTPLPEGLPASREARIARFAETWRELLARPAAPEWEELWALIQAAAAGGEAAALDQTVALGRVPEAAATLLLRFGEEALLLEEAAPLWWPLTPCHAWTAGMQAAFTAERKRLAAHFTAEEAERFAKERLLRRAGMILSRRPALRAHLGAALTAVFDLFPPSVPDPDQEGRSHPLFVPDPAKVLREAAHELIRREPVVPGGTQGLSQPRRQLSNPFHPRFRPLLDAPLCAAEIAAGLVPESPADRLRLILLAHADPEWFATALPAALQWALDSPLPIPPPVFGR